MIKNGWKMLEVETPDGVTFRVAFKDNTIRIRKADCDWQAIEHNFTSEEKDKEVKLKIIREVVEEPELKILNISPVSIDSNGSDLTLIDCNLGDLNITGVNGVEIIISPLHKRWAKRVKAWLFGMHKRYEANNYEH